MLARSSILWEDSNSLNPLTPKGAYMSSNFPSKAGAYSLHVRKGYRHARGVA